MSIIDNITRRIDAYQRSHRPAGFLYGVIKKFGDDEAGYQAGLMAYYGFLSLFPLLMVFTTLVTLVLKHESKLRHSILTGVTNYFPTIGNELQQSVHGMKGSGVALAVGLLLTFYGARGVADIFRNTVNHISEVPYADRIGFPGSLVRSLKIIIVGGVGLSLAPIISGYAAAAGHGPLFWMASLLITLVILFGVFVFLLRTSLPEQHKLHEVWPSALMAAIGLQILQSLGALLLTRQLKHLGSLYGTFAVVLGLLFWLYLQAQIIVYALEAGTVKAYKLYPRSLVYKEPTDADKRAYQLYTERNRFHGKTDEAAAPSAPGR